MKKLMILAAMVVGAMAVNAEFLWSTWDDDGVRGKEVKGCVLGLASDVKAVTGAQVGVCANKAEAISGGAQVSFGYNRSVKVHNGCQLGFWNKSDSSALQLGLINFNQTGFLPFFPFINLDVKMFGPSK